MVQTNGLTYQAIESMRSRGFVVQELVPDGEFHRFDHEGGKKNGWYIASISQTKTGEPFLIVNYGDWRNDSKKYTYCTAKDLTKEHKDAIDSLKEKVKQQSTERQKEAGVRAERIWEKLKEQGPCPYLRQKGISELYGARVDNEGNLYVQTLDPDGKMCGFQKITPEYKRFLSGQRTKGCFFCIRRDQQKEKRVFTGKTKIKLPLTPTFHV